MLDVLAVYLCCDMDISRLGSLKSYIINPSSVGSYKREYLPPLSGTAVTVRRKLSLSAVMYAVL